jgi:peptide/nickel transport system permease protein
MKATVSEDQRGNAASTVNDLATHSDQLSHPDRKSRNTVWQRFRRHRLAVFGLTTLSLFCLIALFAPWIAPHDPNFVDITNIKAPPSADHLLGTDAAGRDVLSRLIYGARISMSVGLVAVVISSLIGIVIGLISGFIGGRVDTLLMRFTELVMTFPAFFAVVILVALIGPNVYNVMLVIGVLGWTGIARLVRGQALSLREMDYVSASRATGASDLRILVVHILPGVMPIVMVAATLGLASAILIEAALSFLGLGVRIPTATWGNMLYAAQSLDVLENQPWLWIPPGAAIALAVLAANFVGDGLRDAVDPRMQIN